MASYRAAYTSIKLRPVHSVAPAACEAPPHTRPRGPSPSPVSRVRTAAKRECQSAQIPGGCSIQQIISCNYLQTEIWAGLCKFRVSIICACRRPGASKGRVLVCRGDALETVTLLGSAGASFSASCPLMEDGSEAGGDFFPYCLLEPGCQV